MGCSSAYLLLQLWSGLGCCALFIVPAKNVLMHTGVLSAQWGWQCTAVHTGVHSAQCNVAAPTCSSNFYQVLRFCGECIIQHYYHLPANSGQNMKMNGAEGWWWQKWRKKSTANLNQTTSPKTVPSFTRNKNCISLDKPSCLTLRLVFGFASDSVTNHWWPVIVAHWA